MVVFLALAFVTSGVVAFDFANLALVAAFLTFGLEVLDSPLVRFTAFDFAAFAPGVRSFVALDDATVVFAVLVLATVVLCVVRFGGAFAVLRTFGFAVVVFAVLVLATVVLFVVRFGGAFAVSRTFGFTTAALSAADLAVADPDVSGFTVFSTEASIAELAWVIESADCAATITALRPSMGSSFKSRLIVELS